MQQATINLLADMDAQPATIQPPLATATKSTDTTPPAASINAPLALDGNRTTISGTAIDSGGGVVGAVEVSVDDGKSWHPAEGRENWSYTWTPSSLSGSMTVLARAADDSANLQPILASATFAVTGGPACPCSVWTDSTLPESPQTDDTSAVEIGMKFRSDVAGYIKAVRFYKTPGNTGTHIGNLWTLDGGRLASATFTSETPSGWQQASFSRPVPIAANTTYVISYYAPHGRMQAP